MRALDKTEASKRIDALKAKTGRCEHDPLGLKQRLNAATPSLPLAGYRESLSGAGAIPLPPCRGGRLGRRIERGGARPATGLPVEAGPPCISRRGKAHAIRQARPLRLDDFKSPSSARCCPVPGAPLLARPSAESVLPTRGGGCVESQPGASPDSGPGESPR